MKSCSLFELVLISCLCFVVQSSSFDDTFLVSLIPVFAPFNPCTDNLACGHSDHIIWICPFGWSSCFTKPTFNLNFLPDKQVYRNTGLGILIDDFITCTFLHSLFLAFHEFPTIGQLFAGC